ncbi:SMP-30/gluconolactonase/LRE family protein [Aurantiacibacter spongiae]|uniref:SMP-30/gluconolactonase/LRE family protein n=1 Tax=Aurantiacibacter spongiae TaxID=2488860 RepID=A0A3N5CU38_9SPHN|nr:SMP-30/gluconolactonase/LRE family protein [Aurantiacibacter spongiae]RPF70930.1 SMP-30/gluconolactonase/LRE family protein [Aurantiacibacter spongiae]
MEIELPVRQLLDTKALLGEGAVWDHARKIVWFVDIKRRHLWHYDPDTGSNAHVEAPDQIGWALPANGGALLCGLKDGLHVFDPRTRDFDKLADIPGESPANRLNDACTDPWGRVWFGTMHDEEELSSGRFYVFDRGEIRPAGPSGITITNGPAVNRDGSLIYFTDTLGRTIYVADLTADGVGEPRLLVDTSRDFPGAYPDGPVVDAEGYIWTALYLGGRVARYSPEGTLAATVAIPARDVTKLAFGGTDLSTAFVTSATKNMEPDDMTRFPQAGSLFAFDAPAPGFVQPLVELA